MVNIETVPLVLAAWICTTWRQWPVCLLSCACLGVRLVGILGSLDDRICKFQEKLNLMTTRQIKIFEACLVKNVCLHLRCSERKALSLLSFWLTYLHWIHEKKILREKHSEREEDQYFCSLSCCQTRSCTLEVESTYTYLAPCFPWIDHRKGQKHTPILIICSGIPSWISILWQLLKCLDKIWMRMFYKKLKQKSSYYPQHVRPVPISASFSQVTSNSRFSVVVPGWCALIYRKDYLWGFRSSVKLPKLSLHLLYK